MATVTGLTKQRMLEIEAQSVVSGAVILGDLVLTRHDGTDINAGRVQGDPGPAGVGPVGTVSMFAGATAPSGWLVCDGTAVSRTTYADLFNVVGTSYGTGDGTTTFNLPNLKGRVPVGRDAAQTEFDALGETGGAKTHVLSANEMPSHTHTQAAHNHTQNSHGHTQNTHTHTQNSHDHTVTAHAHDPSAGSGYGFLAYADGVGRVRVASGTSTSPIAFTSTDVNLLNFSPNSTSVATNPASTTASNNDTTATNNSTTATNNSATATNNSTGGDAAHNNLQPYVVMNYIIKV